jgi:exopolysaccharide biosynthesis protein
MGNEVNEDQSKTEDSPRSNMDDLKDRNKDKIRKKIKGKAVDSKHINVKVLKSMMPSKHHRIVTNACDLFVQKRKKKALKTVTNKKHVCTTKIS